MKFIDQLREMMHRKDFVIKTMSVVFVFICVIINANLSLHAWHVASIKNDIIAYAFSIFFALLIPYSVFIAIAQLRLASICDRQIELIQSEIEMLNRS